MNWTSFHHPDLCLPILRRQAATRFLDILDGIGEILLARGRPVEWNRAYATDNAFRTALSRLRKSGLIVQTDPRAPLPRLVLTEKGRQEQPAYLQAQKFWNTRWNKLWYVIVFDVPESQRHYRNTLRLLFRKMRMGCLQRSVWVTPQDIRPEYEDLEKGAAVGTVAYLLESRTVLHLDQQELVRNAWDFSRLHDLQSRYLKVFGENLSLLDHPAHSEEDLITLLYQESEAYAHVMQADPLLPAALLPDDYLGRDVWSLRNQLRSRIARTL